MTADLSSPSGYTNRAVMTGDGNSATRNPVSLSFFVYLADIPIRECPLSTQSGRAHTELTHA